MVTTRDGYFDQGRSTIKPPFSRGINFSYWKFFICIFIKTKDYGPWNNVNKSPYVQMITVDGKFAEKIKDQ